MRTYNIVFLTILVSLVTGCDSRDGSATDLAQKFDAIIHGTRRQITTLAPGNNNVADSVSEELGKISAFEYKVVPIQAAGSGLEATLNHLGRARWDCFQVIPSNEGDVMICKRPPQSYLRYIQKFMP